MKRLASISEWIKSWLRLNPSERRPFVFANAPPISPRPVSPRYPRSRNSMMANRRVRNRVRNRMQKLSRRINWGLA